MYASVVLLLSTGSLKNGNASDCRRCSALQWQIYPTGTWTSSRTGCMSRLQTPLTGAPRKPCSTPSCRHACFRTCWPACCAPHPALALPPFFASSACQACRPIAHVFKWPSMHWLVPSTELLEQPGVQRAQRHAHGQSLVSARCVIAAAVCRVCCQRWLPYCLT